MATALAVLAEDDGLQAAGEQLAQPPERLPQLHEAGNGDVTPLEIEDLVRAVVRVQPDPAPVGARGQGDLGAVAEFLGRRNDRRILDLPPRDPAERVAHEAAPGLTLCGGCQVLELAAAAVVPHVVRAAGLDPVR
jgi:hypothetical protein